MIFHFACVALAEPPRRRLVSWRRFATPRLAMVTLLAASAVVFTGSEYRRGERQRQAAAAVQAAGGTVRFGYQLDADDALDPTARPPLPAWLRQWCGEHFLVRVSEVNLVPSEAGDEVMPHVGQLSSVQRLSLDNRPITNRGLTHVADLQNLTDLTLSHTRVGDEGLKSVAKIRGLLALGLNRTGVTDCGLEHLAELKSLQALNLSGTAIGDDGLARLQSLSDLRSLKLDNTQVSDAGLHFVRQLSRLERLHLSGTRVSPAGADWIRQELPECQVFYRGR